MKWLPVLLRLALGGFFVYAGVEKIVDPAGFAKSIANYQLLARAGVNALAITLPWIEVVAGGLLVAGVWRGASALVIAGLLVVFMVAVGWAMAHGLNIECGCTGTATGSKVGWRKLAENTGLLAVALWLWWRAED